MTRPSRPHRSSVFPLVTLLGLALLTSCGGNTAPTPSTAPTPLPQQTTPTAPTQPTPTQPAPSQPATPQPTLSLGLSALSLPASGSSSLSLGMNLLPDRLEVSGQPSGLSAALSGNVLTVTTQDVTPGTYTLTLTGVWGSQRLSTSLTVTVLAPAAPVAPTPSQPAQPVADPTPPTPSGPSISSVRVTASSTLVTAGGSVNLQAAVQGSGNFDGRVTWQSSGGQLTVNADGSATLRVPADAPAGQIGVTATSVADPSVSGSALVTVQAAPQTVTLSQGSLTLKEGSSASLTYSGMVRGVSLAAASSLVSAVSAQNGLLTLTASGKGTGNVGLRFEMQDGNVQVLFLQVTVESASSYAWYSGTDRAPSAEELEVLRLTNEVRARGANCGGVDYPPVPALTWSDTLAHAARNHSRDMGERSYFAHSTPEGVTFSDRISALGYRWTTIAENIAAGYRTPKDVVDGWVASPGHCVNLMSIAMKELGVGQVTVTGSPYSLYWTQDFGRSY